MDKPTAAAKAAFEAAMPADDRARAGQMFGMPCGFVHGNLFLGVFADGLTLRLPAERIAALQEREGVGPFEPREGRPWKDYIFVSARRWGESAELAGWAQEALAHTAMLPPKVSKPRKKKA
jgi:hypothetical protein